jgi:hypothetical protein
MNRILILSAITATLGFVACSDSDEAQDPFDASDTADISESDTHETADTADVPDSADASEEDTLDDAELSEGILDGSGVDADSSDLSDTGETDSADEGSDAPPTDLSGCTQTELIDEDPDDAIERSIRRTYGSDGVLRQVVRRTGRDGPVFGAEEYNEEGYLTRMEMDTDDDGKVDTTTAYRYEAEQLVRSTTDSDGDGTPNMVFTYAYSESGRRILTEHNTDEDPTIEYTLEELSAEFNDEGELISKRLETTLRGDVYDSYVTRYEYRYNENGLQVWESVDTREDGEQVTYRTRDYDNEGRVVSDERFRGSLGNLVSAVYTQYRDDGRTKEVRTDSNGDGSVDWITVEEKDASGRLIRELYEGEYRTDHETWWEYNEYGDLTEKRIDEDIDGDIDAFERLDYEYVTTGVPRLIEVDTQERGTLNRERIFRYDCE